jgi:fibronectin type 3 domain-containing protein
MITQVVPAASPEVDVYWNPGADNVEVTGYRLFRADANIEPFLTDKCVTVNNIGQAQIAVNLIPYYSVSVADNGGTPGKTYYYALRAWDYENNMSNISNCAIGTVRTLSTDAVAPLWSGGTPLSASQQPYPDIDLLWTPATDKVDSGANGSIDHYDVYRSRTPFTNGDLPGVSPPIGTVAGIRNSFVDSTGDHDTTYYYGIVAVDSSAGQNRSVLSNVVSATVAPAPVPDNTAPPVPGNFTAIANGYPIINLGWTASTDLNDAGQTMSAILFYKVYRSVYPLDITDTNKDITSEVDNFTVAHDSLTFAARGTGSTKYNFRIEAVDMAGNKSGMSPQVMAEVIPAPCSDITKPSIPGSLNATIGPSPDIALTWTASTDTGGCAGVIDHYNLYKANYEITASTELRTLPVIRIAGNYASFTDSTGQPNTTYWYVLTAVDSAGNESDKSGIITRTTAADIMAPAAIADLKATAMPGKIQLTWCKPSDNVGVAKYEIYRKQQLSILTDGDIIPANRIATFVNNGTCLSKDDTAVTSGQGYSYAVISLDGAGNRSTISRGEHGGDTVTIAQ